MMSDRQCGELAIVASHINQKRMSPDIAHMMDRFISEVSRVADDEDWKKSDGWVAQLVIWSDEGKQTYVYELKDGKLGPSGSKGPFVATITMSADTFVELIDAVLFGKTELTSERKYAPRHIAYEGERWIIDSERFRKVFRRLGSATGARKTV